MSDLEEARKAMIAKRFGGNTNGAATGGSGTARRKNKGNHKSSGDDKKLSGVLKKLELTEIKGVEEVNFFKDDGSVIQIKGPKIQASIPSNTFVISGSSETKKLEHLVPGIMTQLGQEQMDYMRALAGAAGQNGAGASGRIEEVDDEDDDDDDDIPDLVENFEEVAAK